MTRKRANRVILLAVAIPLLFIGALAWITYKQMHHEALDRALILEIEKQNKILSDLLQPHVYRASGSVVVFKPTYTSVDIDRIIHHQADRVRLLLNEGADPNAHDEINMASLSFWDHLWILLHLKKTTQQASKPALVLAMNGSTGEVVKALLEKGANPNVRDDDNDSPLVWSADGPGPAITQMLLAKGVDVKGSDGADAVALAAVCGNVETLKLLLDHNADVNAKDQDGNTPLQCAILQYYLIPEAQFIATFKLLLDYHTDVNIKGSKGRTALSLAQWGMTHSMPNSDYPVIKKHALTEIIRLLKQHGAKE